jgi:hypothetical protein
MHILLNAIAETAKDCGPFEIECDYKAITKYQSGFHGGSEALKFRFLDAE